MPCPRREQPCPVPDTLKPSLVALRLFPTAEGPEPGKANPTSDEVGMNCRTGLTASGEEAGVHWQDNRLSGTAD